MKYMALGDTANTFPQQDEVASAPAVFGTPAPAPTDTTSIVGSGDQTAKPKGGNRTRAAIATIFGILILVGAVGAGLVLVNQRQNLKQKAASGGGCGGIFNTLLQGCNQCGDQNGTQTYCDSLGNPECLHTDVCGAVGAGTPGNFAGCGGTNSCTNMCFDQSGTNKVPCNPQQNTSCQCQLGCAGAGTSSCGAPGGGGTTPTPTPGSGGTCGSCTNTTALNTTCAGIGQWCIQDANGGCHLDSCKCGGAGCSGATPTPKPAQCGVACNSSADCATTGANGGPEGCVADTTTGVKTCQNLLCPVGHTLPGPNCDCNVAGRTCGQTCSASVGLCDAASNSTCTFASGPACTGDSGANVQTYCVPNSIYGNTNAPAGWTTAQCSAASGQGTNRYVLFNGANPTQAQIQQTCLTPTAPPSPTPGPTASCSNVKIYDTSWNQLTSAQLATMTSGTQVYFTVMGTSAGAFDMARFVINGTTTSTTTNQKPGSAGEFYYLYTFPASSTTFTVVGQLHDQQTGNWL